MTPCPGWKYQDYQRLLKLGLIKRPAGPCELGQGYGYWGGHKKDRASTEHLMNYVYDHCHEHGYVRGILCAGCNVTMGLVDAGRGHESMAVLENPGPYDRWRKRCPECVAAGTDDC
jgi:Recombination endonuclease VII